MHSLFLELIRVAYGTKDRLSCHPSGKDWQTLYDMAKKQSLVGVCFAGLQRLRTDTNIPRIDISEMLYLKWLGMAAKIQQKNEIINRQCIEIQKEFSENGLDTCILKGQGAASYYNESLKLLRQPGDIDIWVNGTWKTVMDYVNARTPNREFDMKHTHLNMYDDTPVEVHWRPSMSLNPIYSKTLYHYYEEQAPQQCKHFVELPNHMGRISAPDPKFEAVHIMYHIFNHFLYEGVGLRQMMDLYFVLVNGGLSDEDRADVWRIMKDVGLSKFAPAAMWVLERAFGMNDSFAVCKSDPNLGQVLLTEILEGGNFGKNSAENKVRDESFVKRMSRRLNRRIRLVKYNPVGLICSPFIKIRILLWKRMVIRKYNL